MNPEQFVKKYYPYAVEAEEETGIPAIAVLSQAALESGWGKKAIGNNLFGVKYRKGDWGYQKVLTTEYSANRDAFNGQEIKSVVYLKDINKYQFKLWCYFADYASPKDAFIAHSELLLTERYKHALRWKHSPKRYLIAIANSKYATDPNYARKMCQMVDSVKKRLLTK
jgi:flagellar protein FlgJ